MVIRNFYIVCITFVKFETDSPLIVDRYGVLPFSITLKRMEPIAWRHLQIVQASGQIDVFQPTNGSFDDIRR
jgi:hypothetical protein